MKILIAIPVYISNQLHLDFTEETVKSIKTIHNHKVGLIVNYIDPKYQKSLNEMSIRTKKVDFSATNKKGNILGAAWNYGIELAKKGGFDYVILSNNDIVFRSDAIDNLVKFAEQHPQYVMYTAAEYESKKDLETFATNNTFDEHPHFSVFMVRPDFVDKLAEKEKGTKEPQPGWFDENFAPAYFEDGDMHNRILRAGFKAIKTTSALFYHYGSRTIHSDDTLERTNARTYDTNRRYFREKWGWDPHSRVLDNDDPIRFKGKPFEHEQEE